MPSTEWVGIVNTTAPKYMKGAVDNTIRKRLTLSMLKKRGRITTGHSGESLKWQVKFDEAPVEGRGDMELVTFARRDVYRQLSTNWREYIVTDQMSDSEKLKNSGTEALVRRYEQIIPNLTKSMENKLGLELYIDGYATGNSKRFCGFDSFTANSTTVAADKIALPFDTYAEKSTTPGTYGGTWSADLPTKPNAALATDWPEGSGSCSYDWMSPKLMNWSSTSWGTSSQTWQNNAEATLRQGKIWCTATSGVDGTVDLVIMTPAMFNDFKNKQSSKQQINVAHKESEDLGFGDVLNFDGMALHYEYGVPANSAYGYNLNEMELCILGPDFYKTNGPEWDINTLSYLFTVGVLGNIKWNPKAFFKAKNFAS